MITLQQVLNSQSPLLMDKRVKLVRHKDERPEYKDVFNSREKLLAYQSEQKKEVFKDCDYIVSFIGLERAQAVLLGVFEVRGVTYDGTFYQYDLVHVEVFEPLEERVIIGWGGAGVVWNQWHHKNEKEVIQILPKGYVGHFPGALDFVLTFDQLKRMMDNPEANHEWYHHLSAINGVYLILDNKTGEQYIGSASGQAGIWQRWNEYAKTRHGDNKALKALMDQDPNYQKNFSYSILQTLPSNLSSTEVVAFEKLYKNKLGSRVHGLNLN